MFKIFFGDYFNLSGDESEPGNYHQMRPRERGPPDSNPGGRTKYR